MSPCDIFKYDIAQHTQPAFIILAKSCPTLSGRSRKDLELLIDVCEKKADRIYTIVLFA